MIKYIAKTEEKPLRINLKCAYKTINRGLWDKTFIRLEEEPKIKEIFHVIRNKVNEIEGVDNMFLVYSKIKIKPSMEQKLKLRITSYFTKMDICFRKAIIKSRNAYVIHVNVNKAKILTFFKNIKY